MKVFSLIGGLLCLGFVRFCISDSGRSAADIGALIVAVTLASVMVFVVIRDGRRSGG